MSVLSYAEMQQLSADYFEKTGKRPEDWGEKSIKMMQKALKGKAGKEDKEDPSPVIQDPEPIQDNATA